MDASYLFYALGAVGNLSSLSLLIIGFSTEMANGFAVIIAQNYGAGNHSVLRKSIALSVKLSNLTAAGIVYTDKSHLWFNHKTFLHHSDNNVSPFTFSAFQAINATFPPVFS